ncbi:hypothetical protein Bcav_3923 [Beutenbergia cavernae DSM 12333]|uniref:Uncharacterized protein n=1 Tax=Beutenbergia cavernae (strain ATCC BAA-8 / DSM 12333 / CCUG 43141 / JCM 11478 / NBRC 16432 / NCIMB 13614 / HKI 0122) TaxID=471853 RepID=C5C524_BEUC1|nr:hypothetical protein [Beutenbergia cavernae]ACQ82164.1 hypothetical protein Bcav_3923 [Beutenbergia cavernae DSM 12333]
MTEAQVWTMLGVFTTLLFGMMTILSTTFVRILRTETGRTNDRIEALDAKLDIRFDSLRVEMNARIDALDRDVGHLTRRMYGLGPGEPEI